MTDWRPYVRFFWSLCRHKWFVAVAGWRLRVPLWRLIIHDWSKFTRAEFGPYARRFGKGRAGLLTKAADPSEFHQAWAHHWHLNPHHWEYWLSIEDGGTVSAREMPFTYILEMVADWQGASRAYTGSWDLTDWYGRSRSRIILAEITGGTVRSLLGLHD